MTIIVTSLYEMCGSVVRYRSDDNCEEIAGSSFICNVCTTILHTPAERNVILITVSTSGPKSHLFVRENRKQQELLLAC
jgi:hypothetical protein